MQGCPSLPCSYGSLKGAETCRGMAFDNKRQFKHSCRLTYAGDSTRQESELLVSDTDVCASLLVSSMHCQVTCATTYVCSMLTIWIKQAVDSLPRSQHHAQPCDRTDLDQKASQLSQF